MTTSSKPKGPTLQGLARRINLLERNLAVANREIRSLKDILNVKNNWPAEVSRWIGQDVRIVASSGRGYRGTLVWVDRYTLGIVEEGHEDPVVLQKGNVESMKPARRTVEDGGTS